MSDLQSYRDDRIMSLFNVTSELINDPELTDGGEKWKIVVEELSSLESLIKKCHTGTRGYEFDNLKSAQKAALKATKHFISMLGAMYGPRES